MADSLSDFIQRELDATKQALDLLISDPMLQDDVAKVATVCIASLRNGKKILFAGNGGSAADAQHLASDLVSRFAIDRPGLAGIALTTDTSALTAIGNDYGFEEVFSRQIEALGSPGDVLIAITTSGRSPNILKAIETAKSRGVLAVALTGSKALDSPLSQMSDICVVAPASFTPRVQELHIIIGHIVCGLIEQALFGSEPMH